MDEFNLKLINWAENAVDFCHNIATDRNQDFDLSFYAFQNSPKEKITIKVYDKTDKVILKLDSTLYNVVEAMKDKGNPEE